MAIPIGSRMKDLFAIYREAWRAAGHAGDGEIMVAFHMFCHEDGRMARDLARTPFEAYFRALAEVTEDFLTGPGSKDYAGYKESMAKFRAFTLESQIASGGAWIGTPDEIVAIIEGGIDRMGPYEHASLQINFSNLPLQDAQRSMRLFARDVLPKFVGRK